MISWDDAPVCNHQNIKLLLTAITGCEEFYVLCPFKIFFTCANFKMIFSNAKVNASKMTAVTGDGYLVTITLDHICPFVQSGRRVKQSINAINKPLGVMPLGAGIRVGKRKI